jgi:hypothetical protein
MVAVVVFIVLVPVRALFRAPALAVAAVDRHEHHLQVAPVEAVTCCRPLVLQPGDPLEEPARGAYVPDLRGDGLRFVMAGQCDYGGTDVVVLVYRSASDESFSLYITDRALENFNAIASQTTGGFRQIGHQRLRNQPVHHRVRNSEVNIWEQAGLIWFWIGPANPAYSSALADLCTL